VKLVKQQTGKTDKVCASRAKLGVSEQLVSNAQQVCIEKVETTKMRLFVSHVQQGGIKTIKVVHLA